MMQLSQFEYTLKLGLGRPLVYLHTHDTTPYHDVIFDACLRNTSYDPQIEGYRAGYLFDVIKLTADPDFFRDPILAALENIDNPNDSDAYQLIGLAAYYAKDRGNQRARQIVYDQFVTHLGVDEWGNHVRARKVVYIDEIEGLLFVAERFGEMLLNQLEGSPLYSLFDDPENACDEEERAQWCALAEAAQTNSKIAAYLDYERHEHTERRPRHKRTRTIKPEELYVYIKPRLAKINWQNSRHDLRMWGRDASDDDIQRAAVDMLFLDPFEERDLWNTYCWIFNKRPFPQGPQKLTDVVRQISGKPHYGEDDISSEKWLKLNTLNVLEKVTHPAVRVLAIDLLDDNDWQAWTVDMLVSNWQDGDWARLEAISVRQMERDQWHGFAMAIRHAFNAHPSPAAETTLLNVYEHNPCSFCREANVESLHQLDALPDWMIAECRHDANYDLREWIIENFPVWCEN
jgi:hypothetical protein